MKSLGIDTVSCNLEQIRRQAQELFKQGYNCSQAVAGAFAETVGLDRQLLLRLAASFGGGFGRKREICGAVSGMGLILGYVYADTDTSHKGAKEEHYRRVQQVADRFAEKNGSIVCRELLWGHTAVNTDPKPDERTESYYKKRPCPALVDDAVCILADYLEKHDE